jgi:hypothetical protein
MGRDNSFFGGFDYASSFSHRFRNLLGLRRHLGCVGRHMGMFLRKVSPGLCKGGRQKLQWLLQQGIEGQAIGKDLQVRARSRAEPWIE